MSQIKNPTLSLTSCNEKTLTRPFSPKYNKANRVSLITLQKRGILKNRAKTKQKRALSLLLISGP